MEFSRSIIRKTYSLKRSMQHFFNTDHLSREKGFRCHKTRYRFWDRVTLLHFQIDRTAWKSWSNTMNVQMTPYHVRWIDIEGQGANLANHLAEWSPSAVVWEGFLRWALTKSHKIVVLTNTFCCEAWIDKHWTVYTQCCSSSRENTVNGCFKSNPKRPDWTALP